jgi:phosphatidylserine/phosphatidylglycerophosphate/cardiolipin synthase-like enzyme
MRIAHFVKGIGSGIVSFVVALLIVSGCGSHSDGAVAPVSEEGITVYFSPQTDCSDVIVGQIHAAEKQVLVQAYSFTSERIARAIVDAHKRGVNVQVILDSEKVDKKSELNFLAKRGIETYVDSKHEKAHNKVILIDGKTIVTGSFNFTDEDRDTRADNVLVITGRPKLIEAYERNFRDHLSHSVRE